jgi:hypothetical protein
MKKAIMSKRGRRFDDGGFISSETQNIPRARTAEEDQEAADKAAGLAASKNDSVGFFERMRMGNIDDPNSEAYRRFGAGRGRANRVPVEDRTPTPVEMPRSRSEGMEGVNASIQARKNAEAEGEKITEGERIGQAMASKPSMAEESSKPSAVSKPKPKPTPKPTPVASEKSDQPKPKVESIMKQKPVATASTFDAYSLNNFASPKAEEEKPKSTYKKNATYSQSGRKAGTSKSTKENNVDFNGYGLGMKRGGSVSKASSRADGIAQRGKTRGKMC